MLSGAPVCSIPPEHLFLITALTAMALNVPVVLMSLIDADRQFFKSQCGLPQPGRKSVRPLSPIPFEQISKSCVFPKRIGGPRCAKLCTICGPR